MNKEDFIKANEKLSKEDIIANYWKSEEELINKIGIEHENYLVKQENKKLRENWNELRLYCVEKMYFYSGTRNEDLEIDTSAQDILTKMQELEGSDDREC